MKLSRAEISVILLIATLSLSVIALMDQSRRASEDAINRAFSKAESLLELIADVNEHYTQSLQGQPADQLTIYPAREPDKIWLPATFARYYTQSYSAQNPTVDFRLYSRDPFEVSRERVLDSFGDDALDTLLQGGIAQYRAIEDVSDDQIAVRLAQPLRMEADCVACHNRPEWGLQNQNWQVGDVRGVWEASILVAPVSLLSQVEIVAMFVFISIALVLGVVVVFPAVRREVRAREFFHDRSVFMEKQAHEKMQEAHTDPLSQIGNRRYFDMRLGEMIAAHRAQDQSLAIIMLDIDHFKRVNDEFGHGVGDQVIQIFAKTLAAETRSSDAIARIGGEEFAVLIPNLSGISVLKMAERIKDKIARCEVMVEGRILRVTTSIGITCYNGTETSAALMKRADDLLYQAKKEGRNRICHMLDL